MSVIGASRGIDMHNMTMFRVTLDYEGVIPSFANTVYANDSKHATILTVLNATANGWPKNYVTANVKQLM